MEYDRLTISRRVQSSYSITELLTGRCYRQFTILPENRNTECISDTEPGQLIVATWPHDCW